MDEPRPYRSLGGAARITVIALAFGAVIDAFVAVHAMVDAQLMGRLSGDPTSVGHGRVVLSDTLRSTGALLQAIAFVATIVVFLVWFHRANRNLPALGARPRYGAGWATASWFVPIAALFIPKRATNDLYRAGGRDDGYPRIIDLWWAVWLVTSVFWRLATRVWPASSPSLADIRSADYAALVSCLLSVAAAVLAIRVVRLITHRQDARRLEGPVAVAEEPSENVFSVPPAWAPAPEHRPATT